jgi:hypothetical protein
VQLRNERPKEAFTQAEAAQPAGPRNDMDPAETPPTQNQNEQPKESAKEPRRREVTRPWLTELQFQAMLEVVREGREGLVLARMDHYKIRRDHREALNEAIAAMRDDGPMLRQSLKDAVAAMLGFKGATLPFKAAVYQDIAALTAPELRRYMAARLPEKIRAFKAGQAGTPP